MALNSCVLIGFLGDMFIRLVSKNGNSTNDNSERQDRFKEGTNSVDEEKRHLAEFGVSRRYFAVTQRLQIVCIMQPVDATEAVNNQNDIQI